MVVKGPSSGQEIYDTPASTDKNMQQTVMFWDLLSIYVCVSQMASITILVEFPDLKMYFTHSILYPYCYLQAQGCLQDKKNIKILTPSATQKNILATLPPLVNLVSTTMKVL